VIDSTVGYTGGATADPTYQTVCAGDGHTEALRLEFDPAVTSFEQLVRYYYEDPHVADQFCSDGSGGGRSAMEKAQYRTAIWAQDEEQRRTALRVSHEVGKEVPVLPKATWYDAEAYHQHWADPHARRNEWKRAERSDPKAWVAAFDPWELHGSLDA
jgi:peptide-methionine (S)-S-oxide reductase